MKLGILDAVPPEFLYADNYITDAQKFIDWLTLVGFKGEMVVYNAAEGQFPAQLTDCDAYLITGSPVSVYDSHPWIADLLAFIRQAHAPTIPMVGICFGHQAIAQALGGQVEAAKCGWLFGLHGFDLLTQPAWMPEPVSKCQLYHINQDQVVSLPPDALHLGQSEQCPYSMFSIGDHILAIQGHPEQPLRAMYNFIYNLRDVIPSEVIQSAHASFVQAIPDVTLVGRWVCAFLDHATAERR